MPISDEEILEFLNHGRLRVDCESCEVFWEDRIRKPGIAGSDATNGTRSRIEIRDGGRKRTIILAKLVYMAGARIVVPNGFEIHHLDFDRYNDEFENLVMLTIKDHLKIHRMFEGVVEEEVPF